MNNPSLPLTDDIQIPLMGFGTYGLGRNATAAIVHALRTGYRHFDSADIYGSHANIAEAIPQSGLKREDIFITSKLWSHSVSAKTVGPAVDRFLSELRSDYLDLLLIHWPAHTPIEETLAAMQKTRAAGKVRALGLSNFDVSLTKEAIATGVQITNDQIEYNLNRKPDDILEYCKKQKVTVTAYSPLERGTAAQEKTVAELAKIYSATRAEVLLNWLINKGMIVIPRSANPKHIDANFHCLQWTLTAEDAARVDAA